VTPQDAARQENKLAGLPLLVVFSEIRGSCLPFRA
jgi:hypothetical protein